MKVNFGAAENREGAILVQGHRRAPRARSGSVTCDGA